MNIKELLDDYDNLEFNFKEYIKYHENINSHDANVYKKGIKIDIKNDYYSSIVYSCVQQVYGKKLKDKLKNKTYNIDNILTPVRQNFIANRIPHFRLAFKESKYGEYKEKCQFTLQNMAKGNCIFIVNRKFDTVEQWLLEIYARCSKTFIVPDRKWRKANEYNMQFLHRNPYKDLHCIIKTMQKKKSKKGV